MGDKKHICVGILAHVDAGKTTLSESLLYESGMLARPGRVDNQDAFLDTEELERARGITIFSKQAILTYKDTVITLVDTPGHVDFSAEMERALWVMDYAILVISGADGVQGHTRTLWRLLERYQIPVFVFVNKMDQPAADKVRLMQELKEQLDDRLVDFSNAGDDAWQEEVAVCDEKLMERYLDGEAVQGEDVSRLSAARKLFPCFFGSALRQQGITELLEAVCQYTEKIQTTDELGARVYKIARDAQGNRLTYLKITSGILRVKDCLEPDNEKVNQIRLYSGERYEAVQQASAGMICAVTGLTKTHPGQGIGTERDAELPVLEPVLTYEVELPDDMDAARMLPMLKELEEEEPELHVLWREDTASIQVKLMGEVQIEVLRKMIADRYQVDVRFGAGQIVYKETIANTVEGVGHFEPLRHYAEVHLLMEPGEPGSGMQFLADCSEDVLDKNWQRLILTHLEEREHIGVLTGSAITDIRITVVSGRAHTKHTEGGDFRQATYRAVRQGLMQAENVLLEPYYAFRLEVPVDMIGRAMMDVENMQGRFSQPELGMEMAVLTGRVPVATMQNYQVTMNSYTKGRGSLTCILDGYGPCHNAEEVVAACGYHAEEDVWNPSSSVFCAHGAGFIVPWDQVADYMHVDGVLQQVKQPEELAVPGRSGMGVVDQSIDEEQIEEILNRTYHANERASKHYHKKQSKAPVYHYKPQPVPKYKDRYLIVDGYNIVHAWDELSCLIEDNLEGARMKLLDILCNYQAFLKYEVIVVFDAYKVKGNLGEMFDYHNIHVVYTKEAETADSYIEKLTHQISKEYYVTVATSDGLVQLITRGQNCIVMSARELKEDVERVNQEIRAYLDGNRE